MALGYFIMDLAKLKEPFPANKISWRVGSTTADKSNGMALAYIDARDVQDRLDEVCGVEGWQCRYVPMHDKKTVCEIGIRIPRPDGKSDKIVADCEWVWKADGAGDSDVEAEKGALSDAFKRAAVKWGIGRYLYDIDSPWVEVDTYEKGGKVFVKGIKAHEHARLESILNHSKPTYSSPRAQTAPAASSVTTPKASLEARNWNLWGQKVLETARKAPLEKLDSLLEKNSGDLVKLRAQEPVLHGDIIRLVQSRQELGK